VNDRLRQGHSAGRRSPQVQHLLRTPKGGATCGHNVDASPKEMLHAAHNHRGVPDGLDLRGVGGSWVASKPGGNSGSGRRCLACRLGPLCLSPHLPAQQHLGEGACHAPGQVVNVQLHQLAGGSIRR
jgi:hypothetical protein